VSAEVELRMLEGSEFQTVGAAMLKPREAKVDGRLSYQTCFILRAFIELLRQALVKPTNVCLISACRASFIV